MVFHNVAEMSSNHALSTFMMHSRAHREGLVTKLQEGLHLLLEAHHSQIKTLKLNVGTSGEEFDL